MGSTYGAVMSDERDTIIRAMEQQEAIGRQRRGEMEQLAAELRAGLRRDGADPGVLLEYQLAIVDLAMLDGLDRTMAERRRHLEEM